MIAASVSVTERSTVDMCCGYAAVKAVCSEYRIHNADVHLKEDCDVDDLVDCIEGSRVYIPCIYVLNKIDQVDQSHVSSTRSLGLQTCVCTCCLQKLE